MMNAPISGWTAALGSRTALAILLALAALIFFERAQTNGRLVNTRVSRTDQGAYINYAIKLKASGYQEVGSRNRMPLYPLLLSTQLAPEDTQHTFFARGKTFNILLALAGLAGIAAVFLRSFPRHHAVNLLFLTAFTVFLFKAPHVQAEILYYVLTFAVFLACWRLFRKPSLPLAAFAGVLTGLGHLTKASVLPGIFCFAVFYVLDAIWKNRPPIAQPIRRMAVACLAAGAFLAVIFPYISKSKEIYGHYFYNVNSTFYFWCDSWDEAVARTKKAGDRSGWPDLRPEDTPSAANYLRTHSTGQILQRIGQGIMTVNYSMRKSYGYYGLLWAYTISAGLLLIWKKHLLWRLFVRRPMPVLALSAYFSGYFLLIAWYSQIIDGNRFILGLFLPWLFTLSIFIVRFTRRERISLPGLSVPVLTIFNTVISLWLLVEILVNCFVRIPTVYGGS
ncbi:MAG TPA: hypothetical protein PLS03_01940 [Terrimicrobiaceae bacterium]|nr:hypothetical protein [Terrimicrobiaceae bacterium]